MGQPDQTDAADYGEGRAVLQLTVLQVIKSVALAWSGGGLRSINPNPLFPG